MAITLVAMFSRAKLKNSLTFQWLLAVFLFFWIYGFMSGFLNSLLKDFIEKSLIMEGVYYNGSYTIVLLIVILAVFIVIKFVFSWLLLLFPQPLKVSKVFLGISILSAIINVLNNKAFNTAGNLAGMILLLSVINAAILMVLKLKANTRYR